LWGSVVEFDRSHIFGSSEDIMAFLFGSPIVVTILLDGVEERKTIDFTTENGSEKLPLYIGDETVKGVAKITCKEGKKYEHQGIKVDFIGQVGNDRSSHPPQTPKPTW
jgi:vacuolar protein sorting-associated protein 26